MATPQRSCIVRIGARQDLINADLELTHFNCQSLAIPAILAISFAPSPLLYPSRIGVGFRGCHPRSSQIGAEFSDYATIGADLSCYTASIGVNLGVQLPDYQRTHLPIFSPHPAIDVLLQTNTKLPFDSLMTALSKPFFHLILVLFWLVANCQLLIANFSKNLANPHPEALPDYSSIL
jgi:hypothetical protein